MKKLKLVRTDNFFFAYQKIPFKWFEITVTKYRISDYKEWAILENVEIMIQITKLRFHFKYDINRVGTK